MEPAIEIKKTASAFFKLYSAMPENIRRAIKEMIEESEEEKEAEDFIKLGGLSFSEEWDSEENVFWDSFFRKELNQIE